jgi:ABC-type lipoprotein export system ATPase subunit
MALLRDYCLQGSLVAVTHNPEILHGADQIITLRDGRIVDAKIVHPTNLEILQMADVRGGRVRYTGK